MRFQILPYTRDRIPGVVRFEEQPRRELKDCGADRLAGLIAANGEAQRFYRAMEGAKIQNRGIWIDLP